MATQLNDLEAAHFFRSQTGLALAVSAADPRGVAEWMSELEVLSYYSGQSVRGRAGFAAAQAEEHLEKLQAARIGYYGPLKLVQLRSDPAANDR